MLAQFNPNDIDSDALEIWATASNRDRRKILEIARLIVGERVLRDGTDG